MRIQKALYLALAAAAGLWFGAQSRAAERFDHMVRNDFFAGFTGDTAALERGMAKTEKFLAAEPNHAEALVWHGSGLFFQGGMAFSKGDQAKGMELSGKGIAEMDRAVALEPKNIGVRIPRGAALLAASRAMPDSPFRAGLIQRAIEDHQTAFDLQKDHLDQLGQHPLGELLFALGDLESRRGNPDRAAVHFQMILDKLEGTVYARRAQKWMSTRQPLPVAETGCVGCHVSK